MHEHVLPSDMGYGLPESTPHCAWCGKPLPDDDDKWVEVAYGELTCDDDCAAEYRAEVLCANAEAERSDDR